MTDFTFTGETPQPAPAQDELGQDQAEDASYTQLELLGKDEGKRRCQDLNQAGLPCQAPPLTPEKLEELALDRILCSWHAGIAPEPQPVKAGQASGQARRQRREEIAESFADLLTRTALAQPENRDRIIQGWIDRAAGHRAVKYTKDGEEVIYEVSPDPSAADRILDRNLGKATQPLADVTGTELDPSKLGDRELEERKQEILEQNPGLASLLASRRLALPPGPAPAGPVEPSPE